MSGQITNDLLRKTNDFLECFGQIFEADFQFRNNFRDITIHDGIYTIPVEIDAFGRALSLLTQERNRLFDALQSD